MLLSIVEVLSLCHVLSRVWAGPMPKVEDRTEKRYVIMNNDWSTAGFIPFLMALDAGMEVLGLTTCRKTHVEVKYRPDCNELGTGNSWQPQQTIHALATLEVGNLSCIPVVPGATYPLIQTETRFQAWQAVHGLLPWQGAFTPQNLTAEALGQDPTGGDPDRIIRAAIPEGYPATLPDTSTSAANFMVEMVKKYPGQVSIYVAGAMTNVALAVRMDPNFAGLAKELVVMGGYVDDNLLEVTGTVNQADINSDVSVQRFSPIYYL